jgi:hypothetical protein
MGPGGFPGLQNQCDLTTSGWVGSIPARSRHAILEPLLDMRTLALPALGVLLAVSSLGAQVPADTVRADSARADTARVAVGAAPAAITARDTLSEPPISPRSAFLRSLIVPGLGQAALDRGTAGGIFVSLEALSLLMTIKSKRDLRVARRLEADSLFFGFEPNGDTIFAPSPVAGRVRARKQHVEDWVALLIFNHLFAAADAFVAAQLWDVPARVSVTRDGDRTRLTATVRW